MTKRPQQIACIRCRCIFASDGDEHCPRCQDEQKRRNLRKEMMRRLHEPPANPWIESLIQREGHTQVHMGGCIYTFRRNEAGHSICQITNAAHHRRLLKQTGHFRLYQPETA